MHENRESSWTSWLVQQDRSAKAINRTADVNVQEESDCAVLPMTVAERFSSSQSTREGALGTSLPCLVPEDSPAPCSASPILRHASPPLILGKSRMRKSARTDLCGGAVMAVPTATRTK